MAFGFGTVVETVARWFAPPPPPPQRVVHEVQPEETLDEIGARYGVDSAALGRANPGLANPDQLDPGLRLSIPMDAPGAAVPGLHALGQRETLEDVARLYGAPIDVLMRANGLHDAGSVTEGDQIWVPGSDVVPLTPQLLRADSQASPYNTSVEPLDRDGQQVHRAVQGYQAALENYRASTDPTLRSQLWQALDARGDALSTALRSELDALAVNTPVSPGGMLPGTPLSESNLDTHAQTVLSRYVNDPQAQRLIGERIADIRSDLQIEAQARELVAGEAGTFDDRLKDVMRNLSPEAQARLAEQPEIAARTSDSYRTPAQVQALVQELSPTLIRHPDEQQYLMDPLDFIERSALRRERDPGFTDGFGGVFGGDEQQADPGEVTMQDLLDVPEDNRTRDDQRFLDLKDGDRNSEPGAGANLYQYDEQTRTLTFFQFYGYNDGSSGGIGVGGAQNHEGDREQVTIQLDERFNPIEVRYSGHSESNVSRAWPGAAERNYLDADTRERLQSLPAARLDADGRLLVYVSNGSHANKPEPGQWTSDAPGILDVTADSTAPEDRIDLRTLPARDFTDEPYYGSDVMVGSRGAGMELNGTPLGQDGLGLASSTSGPFAFASSGPIAAEDADPDQPTSLAGEFLEPLNPLNGLPRGPYGP